MTKTKAEALRNRANDYRDRADRSSQAPIITQAFYEMARTLDQRAAQQETAILDRALVKRMRGRR
jgi:hypothetical protein